MLVLLGVFNKFIILLNQKWKKPTCTQKLKSGTRIPLLLNPTLTEVAKIQVLCSIKKVDPISNSIL